MIKVILLSLYSIFFVYAHTNNKKIIHECIHDQMDISKIVPNDYLETFEEKYVDRKLQKSTPQPIRITLDFKELDNPANGFGLTPSKKEYLKKVIYAAQTYLNKLIKVYPRTQPIKMKWSDTCYDVKVTKEIMDAGIPNSDIHIYVTYSNKPDAGYIANAIWCQLDPNPIVGRVQLNIGTMIIDEYSTQVFQDYFSIALHEILHILGFSSDSIKYWIDPETGKPYGDEGAKKIYKVEDRWNNKEVIKVSSKNILKVTRNHYGCSSIDGMYLENQGNGGSKGSHWERDLLGNEFMTASIVNGVYTISEFTAALLLDTGYYVEINSNMLMPIYWGKNKGCEFFNRSCNSGQFFPEFPDPNIKETCDYFSLGIGSNGKYEYSQCKTVSIYRNNQCGDENYKPEENTRQQTGPGSRCFRSNASVKGSSEQEMKVRCFKSKCAVDYQSVEVNIGGSELVNCKYPNQIINLDKETKTAQGIMKCPSDFNLFCDFPRSCSNNCSNNGVCNNGYCICLNGWAGEDCSKQCPSYQAWDGSRCVPRCPSGQFKNFDNTCKSTCPYKQYRDSNTGSCELCYENCSICSGPAANQCTSCNNGFTLSGNQCIEVKCHDSCMTCSGVGVNQCTSCPAGKFLDSNQMCSLCQSPCSNCVNTSKQCTMCNDGYFMDDKTGQCTQSNCDSSCFTCSVQRDPNKCTSCREGYMLSQQGQCLKCEKQCKTCNGSQNQCIECNTGYTYNTLDKNCNLECDKSCLGCSAAKDSRACVSCLQGKYLKDGQCLSCDISCEQCQNSANFCTRCQYGEILDQTKGTCTPTCRVGEFLERDGSCKRCSSPCATCQYYENYCITCVSGYDLVNRQTCKLSSNQCHPSCNTCKRFNDERDCDSCRNGMYLNNGSCFNCPNGCLACNNANNCTICSSEFQLQSGKCVQKQCHASCKTCSSDPSGNKTFCTSCNDGLYLSGESCLSCQSPCKTCLETSYNCLTCDENIYNYNSRNRTCEAKTCHPNCKTCTKPNDSQSCSTCYDGYVIQGQVCQSCSPNCRTCSNNVNYCASCQNGYELNNGICKQKSIGKCHPSCATCFRDNDELACSSCLNNQWLQTNQDKSLARCLPCDSACRTCTSTYECTSCNSESVLDDRKYCVPKTPRQVSNPTCDQTCSSCIGTYYDQCTSCAGNRVLSPKKNLNYGNCNCPQKTTDVGQPYCQITSNLQSNIYSTTSSTFTASAVTSTIVSASTSNPVSAIGLIEFSQSVSYLSYVNKKPPLGFDDTMNAVSYSHASNLFNLDSYAEQDAENERQIKKMRSLYQNDSIHIDEEDEEEVRNPKFTQFRKTQLFLINALLLIVVNSVVWIISGILALIKVDQDKNSLFFKIRRIYNISIPIVVFTLSSQEFSLLMFLQMLNLKTVTGLQILSSIFSFLTLFYIVGFTSYLFYFLEYKRILSGTCQDNSLWQQRFYLIYKYIKQDSFFTRNFCQITVLRKVIISFITACVVSSAIAQITLLILCYTSYLIYLNIFRPFKSNLYTVMMIVLDSIILLIHVLYCIMFTYEGDSEKEKVVSLIMLFLTFCVFFAYLIYTLIIIGQICYNLFKKWQLNKENNKNQVQRPQVQEQTSEIIEQQIGSMNQNIGVVSSNLIQSTNQLDEKRIIFSNQGLVKN